MDLYAQSEDVDSILTRPKIGLVLSGGAAHGFAHIGVLKRLEELNIPIDYITGTSMGAVVGGMYAMGYTADEILEIGRNQDWSLILTNAVPLQEVSAIEKPQHQKNPFHLVWNGEEFNLPGGVLGGQKMDLILRRLYCPAHFIYDYDDLPIPFRCVAVDIAEGDIVTFNAGYLGKSIRASMAIPSVFPPVEIDNHLYVDGGLLRNFPVEENIAMGSDIIIGSYVGSRKDPKEELVSLIDVLSQATSMAGMLDSEEQSALLDVLIEPDCDNYSYFDFDSFEEINTAGYVSASGTDSLLLEVQKQLEEFDKPAKPEKLVIPDKIKVNKIVLYTTIPAIRELIYRKLGFAEGDYVDIDDIETAASEVYGTNYFSKVSYDLFKYEDGIGLELITKRKEPFKIGLSYNRFEYYNSSLIINAEIRNVFSVPSRIYLTSRISTNPGIDLLYQYRFWNNPNWVFQSRLVGENFDVPFYKDGVIDRRYSQSSGTADFRLLKELGRSTVFSLAYKYDLDILKPKIVQSNDIQSLRVDYQTVNFAYNFNNLNRQNFPSRGTQITADIDYIIKTDQVIDQEPQNSFLSQVENELNLSFRIMGENYIPVADKTVWKTNASFSISSNQLFLKNYRIGGTAQTKYETLSFIGINDSEYLLGNHISVNTGIQYQPQKNLYMTPKFSFVYGNNLLENAYVDVDNVLLFGAGIEFGLSTMLGPVLVDFGYSFIDESFAANMGVGYRHIF